MAARSVAGHAKIGLGFYPGKLEISREIANHFVVKLMQDCAAEILTSRVGLLKSLGSVDGNLAKSIGRCALAHKLNE
jgi:hypothetical protein